MLHILGTLISCSTRIICSIKKLKSMTKIFQRRRKFSIIFIPIFIMIWLVGWLLIFANPEKSAKKIKPKQTILFEGLVEEDLQEYSEEIII